MNYDLSRTLSEDVPDDAAPMEGVRIHLRNAARHGAAVVFALAVRGGLKHLIDSVTFGSALEYGMILVSLLCAVVAIGHGLSMLMELGGAGTVAWQIESLRRVLAVGLLVTAALSVGLAHYHYTDPSTPFEDDIQEAQDKQEAALEAAAAAEDPDVTQEHIGTAREAELDRLVSEIGALMWRLVPAMCALVVAGFALLSGLQGLLEAPKPEVNNADV